MGPTSWGGWTTLHAHPTSEVGPSGHFYPLTDPASPSKDLENFLSGWPGKPTQVLQSLQTTPLPPWPVTHQATHETCSPWLAELSRGGPGPLLPASHGLGQSPVTKELHHLHSQPHQHPEAAPTCLRLRLPSYSSQKTASGRHRYNMICNYYMGSRVCIFSNS